MTAVRMWTHSTPIARRYRELTSTTLWSLPGVVLAALLLCAGQVWAAADQPEPNAEPPNSVLPLYRALRTVKLDATKVFKIREATLERDDLHIFLNDGTVVFTSEVGGRVTGMYFEGDGELLVRPPNRTERESLGLFTNLGVLEDKFRQAYFRFNDDVLGELKPFLRPPDSSDPPNITKFDAPAEQLADVDALRLLVSFTGGEATDEKGRKLLSDHFLHARIGGSHFGLYDLFYDTHNPEQIAIGQAEVVDGLTYYDLWMSFAGRRVRDHKADGSLPLRTADALHVDAFKIDTTILPPNDISSEADLEVEVKQGGPRVLFFELSHALRLKQVTLANAPLEWLQNEPIEGSQLARQGNDFIAVILPRPCMAGDHLQLHFTYQGSVLSDAGNGLLYVGAHGTWYPNFGLTPSQYDLTFTYPKGWTLESIGKRVAESVNGEMRKSHWISDRPVPVAGFNLGIYVESLASAGPVQVGAYGSHGVEKDFPKIRAYVVERRQNPWSGPSLSEVGAPLKIDPSVTTKEIARAAAATVDFYDHLLGPYPFSSLRLTQFPGPDSQGWPGLIYLSSYTFLTAEQRHQLGMNEFVQALFATLMLRHEIAHMWWGHEVFWSTYRDQWISEALANYSALLMSEQDQPDKVRVLMNGYRDQLLSKRRGRDLFEAGPVTLGQRLNSAKFPDAYEAVAYGRGTWLIHMLRCMLEDAARGRSQGKARGDDLFLKVLRSVLQRHRDTGISTDDLRHAFEEVLPESLCFEGRKSLDWFFDGWVNGVAVPSFEVSAIKFTPHGEQEFVSGVIRQKHAPDDLVTSIPVYAQIGEKLEYLGRVFAVGNETRFRLLCHGPGRKIVLDPYHTVLRREKG